MARRGWLARTLVYSVTGYLVEVGFSALHDRGRGRPVRLRTSGWMLPIYALITPFFEPLHRSLEGRAMAQRGLAYGLGFLGVEYGTGWTLRRIRGRAPWDYSYARVHMNGLVRPDYFFLWAAAGLALEPLHDALTSDQSAR